MTQSYALTFPIFGSISLVGLFLALRYLGQDLANRLLLLYFNVLGSIAVARFLSGLIQPFCPRKWAALELSVTIPNLPYLTEGPSDVALDVGTASLLPVGVAVCWYNTYYEGWLANNAIGTAISVVGIEEIGVGSVSTGTIMLAGLFVYDIFWVFCTPVMVGVARGIKGHIKLLFPIPDAPDPTVPEAFSLLGLGDIVVPGTFVIQGSERERHRERERVGDIEREAQRERKGGR